MKTPNKAGFTLTEFMIVIVIVGLIAAMAIPAFNKVRGRTDEPATAEMMLRTDGEDRFTLVRVSEFADSFAYTSRRAAYILTDKQTGKQYVGVSGIGIVEIGTHADGENTVEDEQ